MSTLQTKANGAKIVAPATDTTANAVAENKKEPAKMPKLESTADKRLKNLALFEKICDKYRFLKSKADSLTAYLVGRDGLKETIIIENTNGITFEISNSIIISKILEMCQDELLNLTDQAESEVSNFKI